MAISDHGLGKQGRESRVRMLLNSDGDKDEKQVELMALLIEAVEAGFSAIEVAISKIAERPVYGTPGWIGADVAAREVQTVQTSTGIKRRYLCGTRGPCFLIEEDMPGQPLLIRDIGPHDKYLTVTNGADRVVALLYKIGMLPDGLRALLCIDTEGQIDQLVHKGGLFVRFVQWRGGEEKGK